MPSFLSTRISANDQARFDQHYALFHFAVGRLPVFINGCFMCPLFSFTWPLFNSYPVKDASLSGRCWIALADQTLPGDDRLINRPIGLCGLKTASAAGGIIYQPG
tara:strand:+ start:124 stop:438 length:315 start_codon:yes stop_codon:yes gene_type:complete